LTEYKGHVVPDQSVEDVEAKAAITRKQLDENDIVNLDDGVVEDEVALSDLVFGALVEGQSNPIVMGDYIWIDSLDSDTQTSQDTTHGLLVAGWGEAENCANVINPPNGDPPGSRVSLTAGLYYSYTSAVQDGIQHPVPYVVDFSRGLQQPIPRPFYCTSYDAPSYNEEIDWSFFLNHDWYFFSLPYEMSIESNRLFVDLEWSWEESDGIYE
jgi:hypothetical protein